MRLHEGTCMTEGTQVREGIYVKEGIQVHGGTKAQAHEGICADEGIPAHRDAPTGAGFPSLKAGLPDTHTGPWPLTLDDGQCDPGGGSGEPDDPANRARAPERQPLSGGRGAGGDRGHQGRGRRRDPPSRPLPARPEGMPGSATPAGKRSRGSSAQSGENHLSGHQTRFTRGVANYTAVPIAMAGRQHVVAMVAQVVARPPQYAYGSQHSSITSQN